MSRARTAAVGAAALLLLAGCTGGEGSPEATPPGTGTTGTPESDEVTAEELTAELLQDPVTAEPVATVTGTVESGGRAVEVTADILAVEATESGTRLRWQLRSTSGQQVDTYGSSLAAPPYVDTRAVSLRDAAGEQVLLPYVYQQPGYETAQRLCVCSQVPQSVDGEGEELNALFPPLGEQTDEVDVVIPGFDEAAGVPVTRS